MERTREEGPVGKKEDGRKDGRQEDAAAVRTDVADQQEAKEADATTAGEGGRDRGGHSGVD